MAIITLTTDLGCNSGELGRMKGIILSYSAKSILVDISHEDIEFNINHIFHKLFNIHTYFPAGTVHVIYAYTYYADVSEYIVAKHQGQYFIAPNNGILDLLLGDNAVYRTFADSSESDTWPGELFGMAAAKLSEGAQHEAIGHSVNNDTKKMRLTPIVTEHMIRATVMHIDTFGNVILNVDKSDFSQQLKGRKFAIYYKRYDPIHIIHQHYAQVPVGKALARFNSDGFLEIAIHLGNAHTELNLNLNDLVQIQFFQDV